MELKVVDVFYEKFTGFFRKVLSRNAGCGEHQNGRKKKHPEVKNGRNGTAS